MWRFSEKLFPYDLCEVAITRFPIVLPGPDGPMAAERYEWTTVGWRWSWQPGELAVWHEGEWMPIAAFANWQSAVSFTIGWHARGKLKEGPSELDG